MATLEDTKDGFTVRGAVANQSFTGFILLGGKYGFVASDTGATNCSLYLLAPDGTSEVLVDALTNPGVSDNDLMPGTYAVTFGANITLGYCAVHKIASGRL